MSATNSARSPQLQVAHNIEATDGVMAEYVMMRGEEGKWHTAYSNWASDLKELEQLDSDVVHVERSMSHLPKGERTYVLRLFGESDSALAYVKLGDGFAAVIAASSEVDVAEWAVGVLQTVIPEAERKDGLVPITFWSYGQNGPSSVRRDIEAEHFDEMSGNYSEDVRLSLDDMFAPTFVPGFGGQLVLWSGPAGTGKTNALRALASEWQEWCGVHYITDPEKFFGTQADYMMSVMLGDHSDERWRLLVLEDAGELLRKDAADVTGKALSRMLNAVDGLIGQGLKVLVLVTTNEDIGELHEAVARPGRCAVEIEFKELDGQDAQRWREEHDLDSAMEPATLAKLYAELHGFSGARKRKAVGFAS